VRGIEFVPQSDLATVSAYYAFDNTSSIDLELTRQDLNLIEKASRELKIDYLPLEQAVHA